MQTKSITINRNEVVFDLQHDMFKRADTSGLTEKEKTKMNVSMDDDMDWIIREVTTALGRVNSAIGAHASDLTTASDAISSQPTSWTFQFLVPTFWGGTVGTMTDMLHAFIVDYCIFRWLMKTSHASAEAYNAAANADLQSIIDEVYKTKAPTKASATEEED